MRRAPHRLLAAAAAALIGMAVAAPAVPASAAAPELSVHFPDLAVAAGAPGKVAAVMAWVEAPGARKISTITLSADLADLAGIATVAASEDLEVAGDTSCDRAGDTLTCELTGAFLLDGDTRLLPLAVLQVTAARAAVTGATGDLAFTVRADDGPAARSTATVRIGEGVDLAGVDTAPLTLAPGATGSADLRVANHGAAPVDGVVLAMLGWDERLLAGDGFGNCTYGLLTVCTFTDELAPGATYGLSAPVRLRMPADAATGSSATAIGAWYTPADFAELIGALPGEPGEEVLGRPGTGPAVRLTEVAGASARAAQVDTNPENNLTISEVTVRGGERTDLAAVGATVTGAPGTTVPARVGFVNRGPGTLYHLSFENTDPATRVTVPAGLEAVEVDDRCMPLGGFDDERAPEQYLCGTFQDATKAKTSVLFDFTFEIGTAAGKRAGTVAINEEEFTGGPGIDRDPRNDTAAITVAAAAGSGGGGAGGGLPVTGANGTLLGAAGVVLLLAGAAGVLVARRRRVRFTA